MKLKNIAIVLAALAIPLAACTQSQIKQAESLTQVILEDVPPILQILAGAGVLAQPELSKDQAVAGQAEADLALAETLIQDYQTTPTITTAQKIQAALADAQANLATLLQAARVLNPQKRELLAGAITLLINNVRQVSLIFPTQATARAVKVSNQVKLPSVKELQDKFHQFIPATR